MIPVLKLVEHFKRDEFTESILKDLAHNMTLEQWPKNHTIYR